MLELLAVLPALTGLKTVGLGGEVSKAMLQRLLVQLQARGGRLFYTPAGGLGNLHVLVPGSARAPEEGLAGLRGGLLLGDLREDVLMFLWPFEGVMDNLGPSRSRRSTRQGCVVDSASHEGSVARPWHIIDQFPEQDILHSESGLLI